jgi:hypothetical protein
MLKRLPEFLDNVDIVLSRYRKLLRTYELHLIALPVSYLSAYLDKSSIAEIAPHVKTKYMQFT